MGISWKNERYAIIVEEDELAICREKFNLSNNNVQTDKVKTNVQMST